MATNGFNNWVAGRPAGFSDTSGANTGGFAIWKTGRPANFLTLVTAGQVYTEPITQNIVLLPSESDTLNGFVYTEIPSITLILSPTESERVVSPEPIQVIAILLPSVNDQGMFVEQDQLIAVILPSETDIPGNVLIENISTSFVLLETESDRLQGQDADQGLIVIAPGESEGIASNESDQTTLILSGSVIDNIGNIFFETPTVAFILTGAPTISTVTFLSEQPTFSIIFSFDLNELLDRIMTLSPNDFWISSDGTLSNNDGFADSIWVSADDLLTDTQRTVDIYPIWGSRDTLDVARTMIEDVSCFWRSSDNVNADEESIIDTIISSTIVDVVQVSRPLSNPTGVGNTTQRVSEIVLVR